MDMLVGFQGDTGTLDAATLRRYLTEAETQVHGSQPLLVFDNHDNMRSHDRYGDGTHRCADRSHDCDAAADLPRDGADVLRRGAGDADDDSDAREDVKDPIGVTGWPKEKGRDGERTPMQWDASSAQAGFSSNAKTWLPVPANYKELNVKTEAADPQSLLNWHKTLIHMRRVSPALHDGGIVMIDRENSHVLSYVRTAPAGAKAVVVSLNMSASPQTVHLNLGEAGMKSSSVKTLLSSDPALGGTKSVADLTLPAYASYVGEVQ